MFTECCPLIGSLLEKKEETITANACKSVNDSGVLPRGKGKRAVAHQSHVICRCCSNGFIWLKDSRRCNFLVGIGFVEMLSYLSENLTFVCLPKSDNYCFRDHRIPVSSAFGTNAFTGGYELCLDKNWANLYGACRLPQCSAKLFMHILSYRHAAVV